MYPTNYMNPMNNQPMSPDYGYNRMQQVQQMQQAINPTVPNMFGQMNQMNNMNQQQQTPYISAIPVTCLDEANLCLHKIFLKERIHYLFRLVLAGRHILFIQELVIC